MEWLQKAIGAVLLFLAVAGGLAFLLEGPGKAAIAALWTHMTAGNGNNALATIAVTFLVVAAGSGGAKLLEGNKEG